MAYDSFSSFVAALEGAGELKRFAFPVATELEITEIADREMKSPGGGKALLFEKPTVNGAVSSFPLAINTMGSKRRMAMALGLKHVDELMRQMELILKAKPPTSLKHAWTLAMQGLDLLNAKPKHVRTGACKEVVLRFPEESKDGKWKMENGKALPATPTSPVLPTSLALATPTGLATPPALPTLLDLPILQCWPRDGGRFITLPCVHTRDPEYGGAESGDVPDANL